MRMKKKKTNFRSHCSQRLFTKRIQSIISKIQSVPVISFVFSFANISFFLEFYAPSMKWVIFWISASVFSQVAICMKSSICKKTLRIQMVSFYSIIRFFLYIMWLEFQYKKHTERGPNLSILTGPQKINLPKRNFKFSREHIRFCMTLESDKCMMLLVRWIVMISHLFSSFQTIYWINVNRVMKVSNDFISSDYELKRIQLRLISFGKVPSVKKRQSEMLTWTDKDAWTMWWKMFHSYCGRINRESKPS